MKNKSKVLFVASECLGYAKTGGLADVVASLSVGLAKNNYDVKVVLPLYRGIKRTHLKEFNFLLSYETLNNYIGVYSHKKDGVEFLFLDNEILFGRDDLYGYDDDVYRYGIFDRAVLDLLGQINFYPDLIHCHDWQAGLVPYILKTEHKQNPKYRHIKTLLTLHNLMYQGWAPLTMVNVLHLHYSDDYAMNNSVNFLKCAIQTADKINTVSPTYRDETLIKGMAHGLEDILWARSHSYCGILNGIDYSIYCPKEDSLLAVPYAINTAYREKPMNKEALFERYGIKGDLEMPLFAIVSRVTSQKGFDLINQVLPQLLEKGNNVVIIGSGDTYFVDFLHHLNAHYDNFYFYNGYNENMAHEVYAASDFYIMPSSFEPCGLSQMIAMSYGSIPVVYSTGGLRDSVVNYDENDMTGCGIVFTNFNVEGLIWALEQAEYFYEKKKHFKALIHNAMSMDYSIEKVTLHYIDLYNDI